ncbi:hypothetical protein OG558_13890 [Kribbella sp. NBC_01510]|uniref:hypothetical protein n=1 Tax=Kribbella sp. NBC_01510 TaxID=2903581 RepID=UPI00386B8D48
MAKLTDDDIEQLLRETFAEKENLVDELPLATKRRNPGPVLLAAAAVLVVLAGVLYGVDRAGDPDAVSPAGQVSTTVRSEGDDAMIWAAAIESMLRQVTPGQGWKTVFVLDESKAGKGPAFSDPQRRLMAAIVRKTAPIAFHEDLSPAPPTCRDRRVGVTLVSEIADEADHAEVDVSLFHDCNHWTWAKYRIEKHKTWVVTATLDQRTQTW